MKQKVLKIGKKYYSHNSVGRLIDRHSEISQDPEEIIRSIVQDKLNVAKQSGHFGWKGPPFNPEVLASVLGIRCEASVELTHSEDAELHPVENGRMVIRYNPDKPKTRRNFSIAHLGRNTLNTYVEAMALPKTQNTDLDSRVIAILSHTRKHS